jgi:pilus assembly protein CpaC
VTRRPLPFRQPEFSMIRKAAFAVAASLSLAIAPVAAPLAHAQQMTAEPVSQRAIIVPKDKSVAFHLDAPAGQIVVSQPETLAIVATTDRSFYVRGKQLGTTNILIYDTAHRLVNVIDVRVGYDTDALNTDLAQALPGEHVVASNLGSGILLSGEATTTTQAARAIAVAENYAPKAVTSNINVRATQQVVLQVRIIEASRTALKDLGFDSNVHNISGFTFSSGTGLVGGQPPQGTLGISGNIGTTSIDLSLRALETKGVIRTLAQPNLAAVSGETASFLAGGEFPYPVPSGLNQVSIQFRPFGVNLTFTPVVEANGLILLKVAPEVSELDTTRSLRISGYDVPGLTTRKVATTVELRPGESFAIAGLFQRGYANSVKQIPFASDVPILGALFRSQSWKRNETELVIIVTPILATAEDSREMNPNPLGKGEEPSAIDLIFTGMALDKPLPSDADDSRKR